MFGLIRGKKENRFPLITLKVNHGFVGWRMVDLGGAYGREGHELYEESHIPQHVWNLHQRS